MFLEFWQKIKMFRCQKTGMRFILDTRLFQDYSDTLSFCMGMVTKFQKHAAEQKNRYGGRTYAKDVRLLDFAHTK